MAGLKSYCQNGVEDSLKEYHTLLKKSSVDTNRVSALLRLGNYYLFLPQEKKSDLDSAFNYYKRAAELSESLHSTEWRYRILAYKSLAFFESGKPDTGKKILKEVIGYYQKTGNIRLEAHAWEYLGSHLLNQKAPENRAEGHASTERAIKLYNQAGNKFKALELQAANATGYVYDKKYAEAEKILLSVHEGFKRIKYFGESDGRVLDWLDYIAGLNNDLNKQLYYASQELDNLQKHPKEFSKSREELFYRHLSVLYKDLGNLSQSELYARKQLSLSLELKTDYTISLWNLIPSVVKQGRPADAMKILNETVKKAPPDSLQQIYVYQFYGEIYAAMHNYKAAEHYYQLTNRQYDRVDPKHENLSLLGLVYRSIGTFYGSINQFKKAEPFLAEIAAKKPPIRPLQKSILALLQSRIDSSAGNYFPALQQFQLHKRLNDSIFTVEKSRQINQLEVSFETKQKQIKIDLLNAQNKVNLAQAQKANIQRNITGGGIIVMCIISGGIFYGFRTKIKSNRILTSKNKEIDLKNESLQTLLSEKEILLGEKELLLADKDMLLKEVHHRVKNNLQIVTSLLSTQLAYLENSDAVQALEESQQRVQAIALIHQKLYRETGGVSIEMQSYVHDLIEDLKDAFNTSTRHILFRISIDDINLDIDLAVPVGLILNEAITNSIKYAFGEKGGELSVSILKTEDEHYVLTVADNGRGLPEDFDFDKVNTLGMVMIKGLGRQIQASFEISNLQGLTLSLKFPFRKTSQVKS
ncbi:hypothetical protein GCM10011500_09770 [Mucilaginibacter rubeus]|nr:hypothetical protein GCM10011500_09770 [Mucilaginibacter rubeus]